MMTTTAARHQSGELHPRGAGATAVVADACLARCRWGDCVGCAGRGAGGAGVVCSGILAACSAACFESSAAGQSCTVEAVLAAPGWGAVHQAGHLVACNSSWLTPQTGARVFVHGLSEWGSGSWVHPDQPGSDLACSSTSGVVPPCAAADVLCLSASQAVVIGCPASGCGVCSLRMLLVAYGCQIDELFSCICAMCY